MLHLWFPQHNVGGTIIKYSDIETSEYLRFYLKYKNYYQIKLLLNVWIYAFVVQYDIVHTFVKCCPIMLGKPV